MIEINNRTRSRINLKKVTSVAELFIKSSPYKNSSVSIAFIGDRLMRKINLTTRGHDKATDILSFPEEKKFRKEFLGEVIIDYAQIKRQAKIFSGSTEEELIFILVHGLFHLLGYEDATEKGKKIMDKLGREFISKMRI